MERLVTTAQAAQILGLSLQGVHYRINHNQLKSLKKSGKTYVYISDYIESNIESQVEIKQTTNQDSLREVIDVKDEQIQLLKQSIKWMKKQYGSEISRLEKNQKRIIGVFNREIELLQSAFNEMRSVYKQPLISKVEEKEKFISLQAFSLYLKKNNKSEKEIKLIILKAIKTRDDRFIYNKKDKKLLILNSDFSDLI